MIRTCVLRTYVCYLTTVYYSYKQPPAAVVQQSETVYDTCNPVWMTEFEFEVYDDITVSNLL